MSCALAASLTVWVADILLEPLHGCVQFDQRVGLDIFTCVEELPKKASDPELQKLLKSIPLDEIGVVINPVNMCINSISKTDLDAAVALFRNSTTRVPDAPTSYLFIWRPPPNGGSVSAESCRI